MARSAGTHEGYQAPVEADAAPTTRWVYYPKRSYQPWPLDWVEPVAWDLTPEVET